MSVTERRHETREMPAGTDRRTADRPPATMRTNPAAPSRDIPERENPEVMGRTEPQQATEPHRSDLWPDMTDYHRRFAEIQSDFIEDPKAAVEKAEKLVEEAIQRLTTSMHERIQRMHSGKEGHADTEQMRLKMRDYRDFINSIGGRRAA